MFCDRDDVEVLSREDCLRLLGTRSFGRLALSAGALPAVVPVHYVLGDGGVLIRTGDGTRLEMALRNAVVAFEVDEVDPDEQTGWSVLVTGVARVVVDETQLARARALPVPAASTVQAPRFVEIPTEIVTGRRLGARRAPTEG